MSALGIKEKAYNLCREYLSGSWKNISRDDMVVEAVSGGMSNVLFLCSLPSTHTPLNGEPSQVLLRMYGQIHSTDDSGTGNSVTKITESVIFMLLSERKLGPKLYGIFPEGRLEEYISARALTCKELRDPIISAIIARKLANVHSLNVPINKEPTWLFSTMSDFLHQIRKRSVKGSKLRMNYDAASYLLKFNFEHEIKWLKSFLKRVESPVVFSHNDLQEGNILIPDYLSAKKWNGHHHQDKWHQQQRHQQQRQRDDNVMADDEDEDEHDAVDDDDDVAEHCDCQLNATSNRIAADKGSTGTKCKMAEHYVKELTEKMVLIDFEYCSYNYRGFDLANHFCEWTLDYSNEKYPHYFARVRNYPSEQQQKHFVSEYLKYATLDGEERLNTLDHLLLEANYYTLASNMLWTLWSIVNGYTSEIEFGYWEYGRTRLEFYLEHKKKLLAAEYKQ